MTIKKTKGKEVSLDLISDGSCHVCEKCMAVATCFDRLQSSFSSSTCLSLSLSISSQMCEEMPFIPSSGRLDALSLSCDRRRHLLPGPYSIDQT